MVPDQIQKLEHAVSLRLPPAFKKVAVDGSPRSGPIAADRYVGFRPLLIWNLRHRDELRPAPWERHLFAVGNDGCGNEYLVDTRHENAPVVRFNHETRELDPWRDAFGWFDYRTDLIDLTEFDERSIAEDTVAVTRAPDVVESILHPIRLEEWQAVLARNANVVVAPGRTGINPFTKREVVLPAPRGAWILRDDTGGSVIRMEWGALICKRPGERTMQWLGELALTLGARLVCGWQEDSK